MLNKPPLGGAFPFGVLSKILGAAPDAVDGDWVSLVEGDVILLNIEGAAEDDVVGF